MTDTLSGQLTTYTGKLFDFDAPHFDLHDVAHALALQPRWVGYTREHYSVAQHTVMVTSMTMPQWKPYAALHDITEAVLCDLPRPAKERCPDYQRLEQRLLAAALAQFGLDVDPTWPRGLPPEVKEEDDRTLLTEACQLLPQLPTWWKPEYHSQAYRLKLTPWSMAEAEAELLSLFKMLKLLRGD